jgi:hypothetical protein
MGKGASVTSLEESLTSVLFVATLALVRPFQKAYNLSSLVVPASSLTTISTDDE